MMIKQFAIQQPEGSTLKSIVFIILFLLMSGTLKAASLPLSEQQKAWIAKNPIVHVGAETDWAPFDFVDKSGSYSGLAKDYLDIIAGMTGLKFIYHADKNWNEILEAFKKGELAMLPALYKTKSREEYTLFSDPYMELNEYIFTQRNHVKIETLNELNGKVVVLVKGFEVNEWIKQHYPNIIILQKPTIKACLQSVSQGEAQAFIGDRPSATYHIYNNMILNVIANTTIPQRDTLQLYMGVKKSSPQLYTIINTALRQIPPQQKRELFAKWIAVVNSKEIAGKINTPETGGVKEHFPKIPLTSAEHAWLEKNSRIRVSNEMDWPPFDFAISGVPQGYSIDLLNLLAKHIGLRVEYVNGYSWPELVALFKKGELDLLHSLVRSPEREKFGLFSDSYRRHQTYFLTRKENPDISDITQLYGKTVAVASGWGTTEFLATNYPQIKLLVVPGLEEILDAVSRGDAYATIDNDATSMYMIKKKSIENLKLCSWFKDFDKGKSLMLHFFAHKEDPQLISMLNKAYALLTPKEMAELNEKWFGSSTPHSVVKTNLSPSEKLFLAGKQQIRMCVVPNWLPFEQIDSNGNYQGIGAEIVQMITERIDTNIILIPTKTWGESLANLRMRVCDILPIAMDIPSRHDAMDFTSPYITQPLVIATKNEELFVESAADIGKRKVGIIKDYAFTKLLKALYPQMQIADVHSAVDGLERVQEGELFGYIDSLSSVGYNIQKHSMYDLKIAGKLDIDMNLSIATRNDEPHLLSIMEKALNSIDTKEKKEIVNRWISVKFVKGIDYTLVWQILTAAIFVLLAILYWNRKLYVAQHATQIALDKLGLAQNQLELKNQDLKKALVEVKQLSGIVPICSHCKQIRDDKGYWQQVEQYISEHSEAQFSHGFCPACYEKELVKIDTWKEKSDPKSS